jgi:hypothetical protein
MVNIPTPITAILSRRRSSVGVVGIVVGTESVVSLSFAVRKRY